MGKSLGGISRFLGIMFFLRDYNCGLTYIFVWGVKQHKSIGEFSAGEEYIMRGGYKSMGLFLSGHDYNCGLKYIFVLGVK